MSDDDKLRRAIRAEIEAERRAQRAALYRFGSWMLAMGSCFAVIAGGIMVAAFVLPGVRLFEGDIRPVLPMFALIGGPFMVVALIMAGLALWLRRSM